jgi:hypothetical protein
MTLTCPELMMSHLQGKWQMGKGCQIVKNFNFDIKTWYIVNPVRSSYYTT